MGAHTVVGILAHVDAGKTTLSEEILYRCKAVRARGRVDEKSAFLDYSSVERSRGITVFSDQAEFCCAGRDFSLIDTPGHVDFSGEMERSLAVLDVAVLVISSVEGIQAHTETLWELLHRQGIPVFLFINKIDRAGANPAAVCQALQELYGVELCDFSDCFSEKHVFTPPVTEQLASCDEALLEAYVSGGYDVETGLCKARELIARRKLFPVFTGAALKGEGVETFLKGLAALAPQREEKEDMPFCGQVYKVRHDKGGRVVFLKVEQGVLRPKTVVSTSQGEEKCNELRLYRGNRFELLQQAGMGRLCAVTGLQAVQAGEWVGCACKESACATLRPLLSARVIYDAKAGSLPKLLSVLRMLEDEEPLLGVVWQEQTQEIQVQVMGEIQLQVLAETIMERFGMAVQFGECTVLLKETVATPAVGCGHFEPLRHYAEVHVRLSPAPRGSGITFTSECHLDRLSSSWQNLVQTHVLEKEHKGVLTGCPLTDVTITLLDGASHLKHTEGGDFREATYRAIRQGLMYGESVLLEPWYGFTIQVDGEELGRLFSDLRQMEAQWESPVDLGQRFQVQGRGPVRRMKDYPKVFASYTRGRGRLRFIFDGYEPCPDSEEWVTKIGYVPTADIENTPDSVFCSHGAGFPVPWNEANAYMHLPIEG